MSSHDSNLIHGNKALADALRVHPNTIGRWRKYGLLKPATVVDCGRTIVYDIEIAKQCLTRQTRSMQ